MPDANQTVTNEIAVSILQAMRERLEEAASLAIAADACAREGQSRHALSLALDIEPLICDANHLLQGLSVLSRATTNKSEKEQ